MLPDGKSRCPSLAPVLHPQRRKYLFGGIGVFILILGVMLAVYLITSSSSESFVLDRTPLFAGYRRIITWMAGPGLKHPPSLKSDSGCQLRILNLNIEGISRDKCDYVSKLASDCDAEVILLQETHTPTEESLRERGIIRGYLNTSFRRNNLPQNLDSLVNDNLTLVNLNADLTNDTMFGVVNCTNCNTDFQRMRKGQVGSQFWIAKAGCENDKGVSEAVTQLDVISRMVKNYSDYLQLVKTSNDLEDAYDNKKVGSLMFVDGGQSLMDSVAFLRFFYYYGVRAMSLGTGCNNTNLTNYIEEKGELTDFGEACIDEMNRLGMMIDIQGLSDATQEKILNISSAPVMISNTAASTLTKIEGNTKDKILDLLKVNNGLLMITFDAPHLGTDQTNITIADVIKHLNYIADRIGFDNIAIGGNYDSNEKKPTNLEDVSSFPNLFRELKNDKTSKWTQHNLDKLAGLNFKRFFKDVEKARTQE